MMDEEDIPEVDLLLFFSLRRYDRRQKPSKKRKSQGFEL